MKKKICFMFGAGAEGQCNYGLPTGVEFMAKSFLDNNVKDSIIPALRKAFGDSYFNGHYKYRGDTYNSEITYTSILKKWIDYSCQSKNCYDKYKRDIKAVLNKDEFNELLDKIEWWDKKSKELEKTGLTEIKTDAVDKEYESIEAKNRKAIVSVFINMFKDQYTAKYNATNNANAETDANKIAYNSENDEGSILELFVEEGWFKSDLPTGLSHILDGHFHTIINPKKHSVINFSKVFNYYWSIFFAILIPILKLKDEITEDEGAFIKNMDIHEYIPRIIREIYGRKYEYRRSESDNETYYQAIGRTFAGRISGVITTNYFNFVEETFGQDFKEGGQIAYLNGQLKLFEVPETLEIIDVTKNELPADKLFFPFIFGQSYTKPIVSKIQIEEFTKMGEILVNSDILVILGYNINEDDNHINSYLREFVTGNNDDKKGTIVIVTDQDDSKAIENASARLRLDREEDIDNIKICKVTYPIPNDTGNTPSSVINKLYKSIQEIDNT